MMEKGTVNSSGEGEHDIQEFLSSALCGFPGARSFCSRDFSSSGSTENSSSSSNSSLSPQSAIFLHLCGFCFCLRHCELILICCEDVSAAETSLFLRSWRGSPRDPCGAQKSWNIFCHLSVASVHSLGLSNSSDIGVFPVFLCFNFILDGHGMVSGW